MKQDAVAIDITPDERAALYFIPPSRGGKLVPEELQQRLQDKAWPPHPARTGGAG